MPQLANSGTRPYRSHKIRACDLCRRRKSRCVLDLPGKACVMCRVAEVDCYYVNQNTPTSSGRRRYSRAIERERSSTDVPSPQCSPNGRIHEQDTNLETLVDGDSELTRIVGPLISDDAKIVQQHCAPEITTADKDSHYKIFSDDIAEPVLYTKAARRHPGFPSSSAAGAQQRIIMEQILGDCSEDLINIYFEKIHPSFPILDRNSLRDIQTHHTVSCEIYAISLLYWNTSNTGRYPRPDANYFWNLAVTALKEEFSNPGLSTIPCALIDLMGRPSLWMAGNAINSGRTVALAHTIGLNRNPRKWKIKKEEQDLRIRLWWGIVIHDRWASFAHGVPPSIVKAHCDVALPSIADIIPVCGSSDKVRSSAEIFISLCSLSEVLGDILPLVYDLRTERGPSLAKQLKKLDVDLDNWEEGLPEWLQGSLNRPLTPIISGCSNFQLGALSVKLLLHRIRLHDATMRGMRERASLYRSECIESALGIVNFTTALDSNHRQDFWLPYAAYHLSSATMLLLRCALEAGDTETKDACISNARRLIEYLEKAKNQDDWDIGSVCLLHCKACISRLIAPQSQGDVTTLPENIGAIPSQFYSGSSWESTGVYDLDDGLLENFTFDMDDIWDDFCSTAQYE